MKRWNGIGLLAGMAVLLCAPSVTACFTMPRKLARPHADVIAEAKNIVWAEVLGSEPSKRAGRARKPVRYKLKVVRVLKGEVRSSLELEGEGDLSGIWDTTFTNHADDEFWKGASGRMGIEGDCSMVPPPFVVGKRYLVFVSPGEDTKQFERVDDEKDRWLQYVVEKTTGRLEPACRPTGHCT
jgi:hypothetical protein